MSSHDDARSRPGAGRRCASTSRPSWRSSAGEIQDETRFREDLDADSLDLYELVMELEDTYGVTMSEEEAAEIETVGRRRRLRPRAACPPDGGMRLGSQVEPGRVRALRADRRPPDGAARRGRSPTPPGSSDRVDSYGRLAFLGDSVLGLAIAEHLFRALPARRHRPADQGPRPGGERPGLRRGRRRARRSRSCCASRRPTRTDGGIDVDALLASASARSRRSARR